MQRNAQLPKCYGLLLVFFFQAFRSPGDKSFTLDPEGIDYQVVMHVVFLPKPMEVGSVQWCLGWQKALWKATHINPPDGSVNLE